MKKPVLLLTTLIFTIAGLLLVRTVILNTISTSGLALGRTQDEIARYKTDNSILREKVFALSSLSNISSRAGQIGFVRAKSNFSLSKTRPIATAR